MTLSVKQLVVDAVKYAGAAIAVLSVVENVAPTLHVSGPAQGVIAAVVTVLTAVMSALRQLEGADTTPASLPNHTLPPMQEMALDSHSATE